MIAQSNDVQDLQRLTKISVFDKYMLEYLREKNQKNKIFVGNRNLENNAVNEQLHAKFHHKKS